MLNKTQHPIIRVVYVLLAIILSIYALIAAKNFLYPIVLGVLFAYLLYPIANFFERHHLPRIPSILISIIIGIAIVFVVAFFIYRKLFVFIENLPLLKAQALKNLMVLQTLLEEKFGFAEFHLVQIIKAQVSSLFDAGSNVIPKFVSYAAGTVFKIGILPVYIFLFLYYRTKLAMFFIKLVPMHKRFNTIAILRDVSKVTTRYMSGIFVVVAIVAVMNSLGLYIIGVKSPILFGIIAAVFTFIPYVGTLIGGVIPLAFTLLTSNNPLDAVNVVILFIIVHFIENNLLSPNIVGNNVQLNPLIIITAIIGASMIWGIPGMFAIVPIVAMLRIVFKHMPRMEAFYFMLGNTGTARHALSLTNIREYFNFLKRKWQKAPHK
jgi:predicted PurR-regulated permease PerM